MEFKKKPAPFVNIGSSSLLVIFLVLCLVIFATLSLSGAQSDYQFSKKLADRRTDYYTACNQAEAVEDTIDTVLANTYEDSRGTYYSTARERLSALSFKNTAKGTRLEMNFNTEKPTISYAVPVNNKQNLSVILELTAADQISGGFYRIRQWEVVDTKKWSGDDTLHLMK